MNKLKTEIYHNFHHWDRVHNHVNVYKDWNLTCTDVERYKYK